MSREMKFRIWHNPSEKFVKEMQFKDPRFGWVNEGYLGIDADGDLSYNDHGNGMYKISWEYPESLEDYIIQQYTGLKDMNGVEVYEGDILRCPKSWMYDEMNGVIEWYKNKYCFINKEYDIRWVYADYESLEVIGNIFENKELI